MAEKQKDQMALSVYRSGRDAVAFTIKRDGSNLSPRNPPWQYEKDVLVLSGRPAPYGIKPDDIIEAVKNNGYSLHKIIVRVTFTEIENSPPPPRR